MNFKKGVFNGVWRCVLRALLDFYYLSLPINTPDMTTIRTVVGRTIFRFLLIPRISTIRAHDFNNNKTS